MQMTNLLYKSSSGKRKKLFLLNIKNKKIVELHYPSVQNAILVATQIVDKNHWSVPSTNKFLPKAAIVNCLFRCKKESVIHYDLQARH